MCDPASVSTYEFIKEYERYKVEVQYALNWVSSVVSRCQCLQSNPNFTISLSQAEQNAVAANLTAARAVAIQSVV